MTQSNEGPRPLPGDQGPNKSVDSTRQDSAAGPGFYPSDAPWAAALQYASRGWPVLPLHWMIPDRGCSCMKPNCPGPGKHPLTAHGVNDATADLEAIRKWPTQWQIANVGIATGTVSGLVVVDVDPRHGGDVALERLQEEHGRLPDTVEVLTGGGGRHLYFAHPGGRVPSRTITPGVDVKADGGYVVAPPSIHASGKRYEWEVSSLPGMVAVAALPSWLCDLVVEKVRWAGESPADSGVDPARVLAGMPEGQRDQRLFAYACSLRAKGRPRPEVEALVLAAARNCRPPFPESQARKKVEQAWKYPPGPDSADCGDSAGQWEPPIPFRRAVLPSFPTSIFPDWLADWTDAEALATQTPVDLAAMLALAALAAAVAKRFVVVVRDGWTEPLCAWWVIPLPSGSRKSAVFRDAMEPLLEWERLEAEAIEPRRAEALEDLDLLKSEYTKAKREVTAGKAERSKASDLKRRLNEAESSVPSVPRLFTSDVTTEKLAILMDENGGRIAVLSPEAEVFELMAGRYSQNGAPNFDVYLKGYSGDALRVDRVQRRSVIIDSPAVTLGVSPQPSVIEGLTLEPAFRGRGLLSRFLYAMPNSMIGYRLVDPPTVPHRISSGYQSRMLNILDLAPAASTDGPTRPQALTLDEAAYRTLMAFAAEVESDLAPHGNLGDIADWGAKLTGTVVRVAGLLHLADHATDREGRAAPISKEVVERAITFARYAIPHAKAAFAAMGADPTVGAAQHILRWVEGKAVTEFTKRDLFEGTRGHFHKADALDGPLAVLEAHRYTRKRPEDPRRGPGRPPSPTYEVNPLWAAHNPHNPQNPPATTNN